MVIFGNEKKNGTGKNLRLKELGIGKIVDMKITIVAQVNFVLIKPHGSAIFPRVMKLHAFQHQNCFHKS